MKPSTTLCTLGLATTSAVIVLWHSSSRQPAPSTAENPVSSTTRETAAFETAARESSRSRHSRKTRAQQEADPAELLDQIRNALNSNDHTAVFSNLLAALVRADPEAAARFAETNDIPGTREIVLHRVAQLWAWRDATAALEWAAELPDPGERDALVTDVCLQLSEGDPAEAVRTLSRHAPGENPHGGLEALTQRWAENDFPAARDWALARPASWRRDRIVARLAFQKAQDSPLEAATLVVKEIPEGSTQNEAVMTVLHQWSMRDPAAAAEWIGLFPDGGLKTRAMNEINGIARYRSETHR